MRRGLHLAVLWRSSAGRVGLAVCQFSPMCVFWGGRWRQPVLTEWLAVVQ